MVMTLLWKENRGVISGGKGQMWATVVQRCSMHSGLKKKKKSMTRFNSFISELTTVYCVPDPRALVWRCLYLSEESLVWTNKGGLSVCQPMASRGCQQHRVMLKLPDEYRHAEGINRFHLVSVHTSKVRTLQPTRTHSHIPAERFSPGSHPSHFVPQTHL